jgi:hypothetical protein
MIAGSELISTYSSASDTWVSSFLRQRQHADGYPLKLATDTK